VLLALAEAAVNEVATFRILDRGLSLAASKTRSATWTPAPGRAALAYTPGQMTYDLRRLRLAGLIHRLPHTNRYTLTPDGIRIAVFYTKVYNRLLVPLTAANQPQAPPELRAALAAITRHVDDYATRARLPRAA